MLLIALGIRGTEEFRLCTQPRYLPWLSSNRGWFLSHLYFFISQRLSVDSRFLILDLRAFRRPRDHVIRRLGRLTRRLDSGRAPRCLGRFIGVRTLKYDERRRGYFPLTLPPPRREHRGCNMIELLRGMCREFG